MKRINYFLCQHCKSQVREENVIDLLNKGTFFICKGCALTVIPYIKELQEQKIKKIKEETKEMLRQLK